MFTKGLLNIMLLSYSKDRIVRGHPGILLIPVLREFRASKTSIQNAIKIGAALSVFIPFHFFISLFLYFFIFVQPEKLAVSSQTPCVCVCVDTRVYVWLRGNGITATQLIRSVSPSPSPVPVFLSLSITLAQYTERQTPVCSIVCPDTRSRLSQEEVM